MQEIYNYIFDRVSLKSKTILDAATGVGRATEAWVRQIHTVKGNSQIISVDLEQPEEIVHSIRRRLDKLSQYVEFEELDIFELDRNFHAESFDVINCDDTIVFLNSRPLKVLDALHQFRRLLKPDGTLVIVSEIPVDRHEGEMQWRRWNLARAIWTANGEIFSSEPRLRELSAALSYLGFAVCSEKAFPARKVTDFEQVLQEYRKTALDKIAQLPWPELKSPLSSAVQDVCRGIRKQGYITAPAKFVLLAQKGKD